VTPAAALALVALACVIAAAGFDLWRFEIPDTLSIVLIGTALGYGLLTPGFGWVSHIAAMLLFFAIGLGLFALGWMGGGDIKLMTGIAAWTGLWGLALQLLATSIAGGLMTLLLLTVRAGVTRAGISADRLPRVFHADAPIPYAVPIAIGTCWWAWTVWQGWPLR
jgi:prepilin peptidase CpaA